MLVFIIFAGLWKLACVILRHKRASLIARLHPLRSRYAILIHFCFVDFPFIYRRSLEYGLFRTYAIPSISSVLHKSGNFSANASKRYDDTDILVGELLMHHIDGDRASTALRRLNFIHSQFKITNADFLYVLSIFVLQPLDWISRYGYRDATDVEKLAIFTAWHDIGVRMGIEAIPSTIEELAEYKEAYERENMLYSDTNNEIAERTMELFLNEVPSLLRPLSRKLAYAFMDDRLCKAVGYAKQPEWLNLGLVLCWLSRPTSPLYNSSFQASPSFPNFFQWYSSNLKMGDDFPSMLEKLDRHKYATWQIKMEAYCKEEIYMGLYHVVGKICIFQLTTRENENNFIGELYPFISLLNK
ncbi:hypothetical protein KP509_24G042700 [Ceratopteris richardii]|uniref:ER-bound oxygenase mpaB/mpaB'/Rubber oxygenase catalytic domain-containing protein n=1 Tax=Ceratopteris richardii TaxID=49495 RepID=A0A8T2RVZ0_CERRI|nr:hypothetical protein KP509_24G042700 [Ceratopteris richardii]